VISGVGHETDFTIADLCADVRAPTPSAAAELAVPDRAELSVAVGALSARLADTVQDHIEKRRVVLATHRRALRHLSPQARLREARQRTDDLVAAAATEVQHTLALRRERVTGLSHRLESLSPLATLERGYAIVSQEETKEVISSVKQVSPGDRLSIRVADGAFGAEADQ
jgi:exodeoxyribonuclease VII large subunit